MSALDESQIGQGMVVPDVIGEIIGWRAWNVIGPDRQPLLRSVVHTSYIWRPGRWNVARCDIRNRMHDAKTQVPMEGCMCGFYAARHREQLLGLGYNEYGEHSSVVIGEVAFVGKVIPGSQGWRAQKARPFRLYVPYERWRLAEGLEETYGCEVRLSNTWTAEPLVPDTIPEEVE